MHKAEVEMRDEIGIETILFGRDYPHPEGTWPNTAEWLRDAFAGVPEAELRLMLGENVDPLLRARPRRAGRDRRQDRSDHRRVTGGDPVRDELLDFFDLKSGYRKPAEGGSRLDGVEEMLRDDVARATAGA